MYKYGYHQMELEYFARVANSNSTKSTPRVRALVLASLLFLLCVWLAACGPGSRFLVGENGWKWYLFINQPEP